MLEYHIAKVPTPHHQHSRDYRHWWNIMRLVPLTLNEDEEREEENE